MFPNHYRAFMPNELVRTGLLHDAWNRSGHVWARPLTGEAYVTALLRKAAEVMGRLSYETRHAVAKYQGTLPETGRTPIVEELADMAEVFSRFEVLTAQPGYLKRGIAPLAPPAGNNPKHVTLEKVQRQIWDFILRIEKGKVEKSSPAALLAEPMETHLSAFNLLLGVLGEAFPEEAFTAQNVLAAMETKRRSKGPLQDWLLEAIALPEKDDWVNIFQRKYIEVDPSMFDLKKQLQPEALAA